MPCFSWSAREKCLIEECVNPRVSIRSVAPDLYSFFSRAINVYKTEANLLVNLRTETYYSFRKPPFMMRQREQPRRMLSISDRLSSLLFSSLTAFLAENKSRGAGIEIAIPAPKTNCGRGTFSLSLRATLYSALCGLWQEERRGNSSRFSKMDGFLHTINENKKPLRGATAAHGVTHADAVVQKLAELRRKRAASIINHGQAKVSNSARNAAAGQPHHGGVWTPHQHGSFPSSQRLRALRLREHSRGSGSSER